MRWGRKKQPDPSSPAPPRPSLLSSWLLRFKKMGVRTGHGGPGSGGGRVEDCQPTGRVTPSSRGPGVYRREDAFWRLSFRKEKVDVGGFRELMDSPVEEEELGDAGNFDQMVSGIRRLREVEREGGGSLAGLEMPRRGKFTRNDRGKVGVEEDSGSSSIGSRDRSLSAATESEEIHELPSQRSPYQEQIDEMGSEDQKSDSRRRSLYVRCRGSPKGRARARSSCRVRIHSPRAAPRAKPTKSKKRKSKEKGGNGLERFAVMKCSFDLQRDFRDSMIEMIMDRRISKPDDLEELLACYLALNSDEYHDVIIEVFRQLWFELNQASCCGYDPAELTTEEERY